jgi:Zn-dependent peptidase ImmA (M78 family)/DNA-binding XRE family transcriptional regulator
LKRYRNLKDLSQEELAKKVGISRVTYTNIETGKEEPKVTTLQMIANALGVEIFKLFAPIPELSSLRLRSNKVLSAKMKNLQEQEKIDFAFWLKGYNFLEETLNQKKPFKLFDIIGTKRSPEDVAKRARKAIGLDENKGVINDICGLIENAGIKIFTFDQNDKCGFGFCLNQNDGGPAIAVNISPNITPERKIFTVAHELGHILLHPGSFGSNNQIVDDEEKEADEFAGYFLMPDEEFKMKYKESFGMHPVNRILFVKRYFKVSYKTVLKRLSALTGNKDIFKNFAIEYKKKYKKDLKNYAEPEYFDSEKYSEPNKLDDLDFNLERFKSLVREGLECNKISLHHAAELLGFDINQMRSWVNEWQAAKDAKLEWEVS